MMNKILSVYAPLWKLGHVDGKIIDVKRELTGSNTTVNALIDNICSLLTQLLFITTLIEQ